MDIKKTLQKADRVLMEYRQSVPTLKTNMVIVKKGMKKVKSVKAKTGGTFEVYERPAKTGQDRYKMYHMFGNGKGLDLGSHPSAEGALKFARNHGIIESADEHIAAMNKLRLANKNKWWNYSSPDGSVRAKGYNTWVQRIEVTKNGKTYTASTTMDAPVSKFKAELKQILEAVYVYSNPKANAGNKPRITKQMIAKLKKDMAKIDKIDPSSPAYKKIIDMLDDQAKNNPEALKLLADADVKFLSMLAKNRLK